MIFFFLKTVGKRLLQDRKTIEWERATTITLIFFDFYDVYSQPPIQCERGSFARPGREQIIYRHLVPR
jgi:hypothetical protein